MPDAQPSRVRSTKDGAFWKKQIQLAIQKRQRYEPWWDANLKAYAPSITTAPDAYGTQIHTNRTFTLVERKKADLFYQRPEVTLQPTPGTEAPIVGFPGAPDPQTGQPTGVPQSFAISAHQEIVNEKLGEDGIDASEMMDAVLFDLICTQAVGFTKMGYESFTVPVTQEIQVGEEPSPGSILGLGPGTPIMKSVTVDVPVAERCFWEHFSGKRALIPADFHSTEWDKAPWLGMQFTLPLTAGNRKKYNLPPDFEGTKRDPRQYYDHGDSDQGGESVFTGVELEYRSVLFREDRAHPDHLTQLILVDGLDDAAVIERDSPYQTLTPQGGLTPDSLIGFSFHPFSVRKMTDSAYVPSDGTMIRPLENELDVFRTQMVQYRDAMLLRYIANGDVLPADALNKIVRSPIGGITVVPGEAFVGDGAIKPLEGGSMPRESFTSNDYIDNDLARTTAIDASQAGVQSDRSSTATEQQIISANANARIDKERGIVLKRYVRGVTKFSTLIQRYFPVADAAQIVGNDRAQAWDAWRKTANSAVAFTAMPDSALRVDQAVDRKDARELYSFLANDPFVAKGRPKLLEKLLRKYHIDPQGIVSQPDPPKPEPPKISLAIKMEDLNPLSPAYPNAYQIMTQNGVQNLIPPLPPEYYAQAQVMAMQTPEPNGNTKHGGKLPEQESLSKHSAALTGGMQGLGGTAVLGAGGHLQ